MLTIRLIHIIIAVAIILPIICACILFIYSKTEPIREYNTVFNYVDENQQTFENFSEYLLSLNSPDKTLIKRRGEEQEKRDIVMKNVWFAQIIYDEETDCSEIIYAFGKKIYVYYKPNIDNMNLQDDYKKVKNIGDDLLICVSKEVIGYE